MPLDEQERAKLDALVIKLEADGQSEDTIRGLVDDYKHRYDTLGGATKRFGEGVGETLKGAVTGAVNAATHPIDTYHGLVDQSANNFTEAGKLAKEGEYGHAMMHGISGILPPFAAVTNAGDKWRQGNVAGALGDATAMGLLGHGPAVVKGAVKAVPKAVGAVARATPDEAVPVLGAAIGAYTGGPRGFMEGALGGSVLERAMPRLRKLGLQGEEGAKTSTTPVAPRTTAEGAKAATKSPNGAPKSSGRDYTQTPAEEMAQRQFEENLSARGIGPDDPLPSDMTNGAPTSPSQSTRMDLEPDFLHQDVVRYPRPKGILRSDESVSGLVNEMTPGVKAKGLKKYPRPSGDSETARALRQRANIAEGVSSKPKPRPVKAKGKSK